MSINSAYAIVKDQQQRQQRQQQRQSHSEKPQQAQQETTPQYVLDARQAIDQSNNMDRLMLKLIDQLTGMNSEQQGRIAVNLGKDKIFRMELAEKSKGNLFKLLKQLPEEHKKSKLGIVQTLLFVLKEFEKVLHDEVVLGKSKDNLFVE